MSSALIYTILTIILRCVQAIYYKRDIVLPRKNTAAHNVWKHTKESEMEKENTLASVPKVRPGDWSNKCRRSYPSSPHQYSCLCRQRGIEHLRKFLLPASGIDMENPSPFKPSRSVSPSSNNTENRNVHHLVGTPRLGESIWYAHIARHPARPFTFKLLILALLSIVMAGGRARCLNWADA